MLKAIESIRKISKQLDKDCLPILEEINLHKIFQPVYSLQISLKERNVIVCYCVLAYDNDSSWLNLKQDRYDNKIKILKSLTDKYNNDLFTQIIENNDDEVNEVIGEYLIEQCTWKWRQIMISLDFHSNTLKFVSQKTDTEKSIDKVIGKGEQQTVKTLVTEFDIDLIGKVNKQKGDLLEQAMKARRSADDLLSEIRKEFVQLDNAVQQDFNFSITDEKNIFHEKWRDFIKHEYPKIKEKMALNS